MYAEILAKSPQDRTLEEKFILLEYEHNKLLDEIHMLKVTLQGAISQNRIICEDASQAIQIANSLKYKIYEIEKQQIYRERKELESKFRK